MTSITYKVLYLYIIGAFSLSAVFPTILTLYDLCDYSIGQMQLDDINVI